MEALIKLSVFVLVIAIALAYKVIKENKESKKFIKEHNSWKDADEKSWVKVTNKNGNVNFEKK